MVRLELEEDDRLPLPGWVRERYGDSFRLVEMTDGLRLIPLPEDPVERLREALSPRAGEPTEPLGASVGRETRKGIDEEVREIVDEGGESCPRIVQRILQEVLRVLRIEQALTAYARGESSLSRAADHAEVSLAWMAEEAARRGIPRSRESPQAVEEDRDVAEELLGSSGEDHDEGDEREANREVD